MNKVAGWIAGLLTLLALSTLAVRRFDPPLRGVLDLTVIFAPGPARPSEPLAVTGETGAGDFIYVKYLDATTIALGYDRWGAGGPLSAPIQIRPGVRYALRLESPALVGASHPAVRGPEKLRVTFNGAVVLDAPVRREPHQPRHAWLGENPIGGSSTGSHFSGELIRPNGRAIRGQAEQGVSPAERFAAWLDLGRWQLGAVLLASLAAGAAAQRLARERGAAGREMLAQAGRAAWAHRWFVGVASLCAIAFGWIVTEGTGRFLFPESFGVFYDHQAASLLQGRLDVPESALSGEAFIFEGKSYGYFGLTPALLRLPFVIFEIAFGQLSRGFMLAYYVAGLVGAYAILVQATQLLRGREARPQPWATALLIVNAGLGSTLFFLGSRAYVYHEAILCGAALALWSVYFSLRWLAAPAGRAWLGALVCGVLSVHARPPSGLFAISALAGVALVQLADAWRTRATNPKGWRGPVAIGALCAAGVLSFNGLSYLKFKTIEGCPLRYNVQYDHARLARIDGRQFHLVNLPFNFYAYLAHQNFRFEPHCPFFYIGARQRPRPFPAAKIDLAEATLPLPYAMPGLFLLATLGSLGAGRERALRRPLAVLWLAVLPMTIAMFAAIACSHRYTGDFCPFLIGSAALAIAALDGTGRRWRAAWGSALGVITLGAVLITFALAWHNQGEVVWGVPDEVKANYQRVRQRVDNFLGLTPG